MTPIHGSSRLTALLLVAILFSFILGTVGGGVAGGLAGYYMASTHPASGSPDFGANEASSSTGQPATAVIQTVDEDSASVDAAKTVGPAVVTVVNTLRTTRGQPSIAPTALGSGVVIDKNGHILTNNHVVENEQSLVVIFSDGHRATATLVAGDTLADLAIIKVAEAVPAVAVLGDSDALVPGQHVIAIGSALGDFRNSVTAGVISGLGRDLPGVDYSLQDLVQTDAPINHGNSGGPLVNMAGQVVGINTAIYRGDGTSADETVEGVGFAIPSNTAKTVAQELIASGKVVRPYLGVSYQSITPQTSAQFGVDLSAGAYISEVRPNTPAAQAGLQAKDIITAVNDSKLDDSHNLQTILLKHKVGEKVTLTIQRGDSSVKIDVTLVDRPANP